VADAGGRPADAVVLLYPVDSSRWFDVIETTRIARSDQTGQFEFEGVRPGRYLAVAVDSVEDWRAQDPELLQALRSRAVRVEVGDSDAAPIALRRIALDR
jgi:hypothetical protein